MIFSLAETRLYNGVPMTKITTKEKQHRWIDSNKSVFRSLLIAININTHGIAKARE